MSDKYSFLFLFIYLFIYLMDSYKYKYKYKYKYRCITIGHKSPTWLMHPLLSFKVMSKLQQDCFPPCFTM